jgi:hypothetical protein
MQDAARRASNGGAAGVISSVYLMSSLHWHVTLCRPAAVDDSTSWMVFY